MRIGQIAKGNWKSILVALGVGEQYLRNKHGPCPICGGKDRFRWDDQYGQGGYICGSCGGGDGFMLAQKVTGRSFREIAEVIEQQFGQRGDFQATGPNLEEVQQRDAMRKVWVQSKPIADVSPVAKYLRMRLGGSFAPYDYLREHSGMVHPADGASHPAMVAKIISHADTAVNLHVTYLSRNGTKAEVTPAKKVMPGKLPDGCAIRLMKAAPLMGVAEGIETAMAASLFFDIPVWACVNGNLLSKWLPPSIAEEIVVFADNDENYTGQAKAYHLANRLEVQHHRRVKVMVPPKPGTDWNDFYLADIQEKKGAGQV